jgi:hypothetical protein
MLRRAAMLTTFTLGAGCAVLAKVSRSGDLAWIALGAAAVFALMFLYAASTQSAAADPNRPSVFRIARLWLKAKEQDLQARVDQKP